MNIAIKTLFLILLLTSRIALADFEDDLSATAGDIGALRELRVKAGAGDADAQLGIGAIFFKGSQIEQDYAEAAKWFRLAAQQGVAQAQYNLGMMYATGRGVEQDYAASAAWYKKAALQHLAIAELNLGVAYSYGEGVEKDDAEALKWFRLAADQGEALAQFNLAVIYANGQAVEKDLEESARWARLAAANGYEIANAFLSDLEQRMKAHTAGSGGAYIQLGAFRTQRQAADFSAKIQARLGDAGKDCSLYEQDGWVRIQIGPYENALEARRAATALKPRLGYEPKIKRR